MTDVIDPVEALRVFVEAFEHARDRYSRRYPDPEIGYRWFDEMPSDWPMELPPFAMKDFRAARAALTAAEAAGMVMVKREVLEPFAKAAALFPWPDTHIIAGTNITARDLRALAAALTDPNQARDGED